MTAVSPPAAYYEDCIWYDGKVKAGDCMQFPAAL